MQRIATVIGLGVVLCLAPLQSTTQAQTPEAEATIAALQTRVAELEQLLELTPTSSPEVAEPTAAGTAQTAVSGNALDLLPPGDEDAVTLVAVGAYGQSDIGQSLPIVVRNNTSADVERVEVAAAARSADGVLLASGQSSNLVPWLVVPDGIAFGYIEFGGVDLPSDVVFDFTVQGFPARNPDQVSIFNFDMVEIALVDDRLVGQVKNASNRSLSSSSLQAVCFDEEGSLLSDYYASLDPDLVEPGKTATFQIVLNEGESCPRYLAAAMGFSF